MGRKLTPEERKEMIKARHSAMETFKSEQAKEIVKPEVLDLLKKLIPEGIADYPVKSKKVRQ